MATQNPSEPNLTLDRRQLLTTAAAVTVAGIVPLECTEAASPAVAAISTAAMPFSDPSALNVCASTARRIEQIAARNRIRQEAGLPLLSIPQELRRMKTVDRAGAFEEVAVLHREAAWDEVLRPVRDAKGEPGWRPIGWMEGMAYQAQVHKILRARFEQPVRIIGREVYGIGVKL